MDKTIFLAGKQIVKVRFVVYGLLLLAPVLFWAGTLVLDDPYVYNMQEQSPAAHQIFWGLVFMMMAAAIAGGILVYQHCYVKKIDVNKATGSFTLSTESLIGKRVHSFTRQDIKGSREDEGNFRDAKFSIRTPYVSLKLNSRRLPFIIDMQGDLVEKELHTLILK
jgi:hypothetical protein